MQSVYVPVECIKVYVYTHLTTLCIHIYTKYGPHKQKEPNKIQHDGSDVEIHVCLTVLCVRIHPHLGGGTHTHMCDDIHTYMCDDIHTHMCDDIHTHMCDDIHTHMCDDIHLHM